MSDLVLPDFPSSLLARLDRYIELLEELNPGYKWSRTTAVVSLLARSLAQVEGAELLDRRRSGPVDRRSDPRGPDRRLGADERRSGVERRKPPYPEMVDLIIDHLLRESRGVEQDTWREHRGPTSPQPERRASEASPEARALGVGPQRTQKRR